MTNQSDDAGEGKEFVAPEDIYNAFKSLYADIAMSEDMRRRMFTQEPVGERDEEFPPVQYVTPQGILSVLPRVDNLVLNWGDDARALHDEGGCERNLFLKHMCQCDAPLCTKCGRTEEEHKDND